MKIEKGQSNFYWLLDGKKRPATQNLTPGRRVYGERLIISGRFEYRVWDPNRSKLAAALIKGLKELPIRKGSHVLYLGSASGTTASHVSDVVGRDGVVYCVEFAPRSMRDLIALCEIRPNMLPLLADARKPREYAEKVDGIEVIYQDVAQPDQARILRDNARVFLKSGGRAMVAIKAPSIDVTKKAKEVYAQVLDELEKNFEIVEKIDLNPFDKDHLFLSLRLK